MRIAVADAGPATAGGGNIGQGPLQQEAVEGRHAAALIKLLADRRLQMGLGFRQNAPICIQGNRP